MRRRQTKKLLPHWRSTTERQRRAMLAAVHRAKRSLVRRIDRVPQSDPGKWPRTLRAALDLDAGRLRFFRPIWQRSHHDYAPPPESLTEVST